MIPFHSLFPELAQCEIRCVHIGDGPGAAPEARPPADEYPYLEFYCDDLQCDCRRAFLQVISRSQPGRIFASINFGWEDEKFYRKRLPLNPEDARGLVRGVLDPLNEQSEFAEDFLDLFQNVVLDAPYRLRLRRHYRMFRTELERRTAQGRIT
jgi:hypothetical protein